MAIKILAGSKISSQAEILNYLAQNQLPDPSWLIGGEGERLMMYAGVAHCDPVVDYNHLLYGDADRFVQMLWLPIKAMSKTTLAIGQMGAGKSSYFKSKLAMLSYPKGYERKDTGEFHIFKSPAFIHDIKGEYLEAFYDPEAGDIIINHLDARGVCWDLLSEIQDDPLLAKGILEGMAAASKENRGKDIWSTTGASWLVRCIEEASADSIRREEFEEYLVKKWEQYNEEVTEAGNKSEQSALFTIRPVWEALRRLYHIGTGASRKWVTVKDILAAPRAFMVLRDEYKEEMFIINQGILSAVFKRLLSRPDVRSLHDYHMLILDEYLSFNVDPSVESSVLTLARSKGMMIDLGMQYLPHNPERRARITSTRFLALVWKCGVEETVREIENWSPEIEFEESRSVSSWSEGGPHTSTTTSEQTHKYCTKQVPASVLRDLPEYGVCFAEIQASPKPIRTFLKMPEFRAARVNEPFVICPVARKSPASLKSFAPIDT